MGVYDVLFLLWGVQITFGHSIQKRSPYADNPYGYQPSYNPQGGQSAPFGANGNSACPTPIVCALVKDGNGDPQSNPYCPNQCMEPPIRIYIDGQNYAIYFCQQAGGANLAMQSLMAQSCSSRMNYNQGQTQSCPSGKSCSLSTISSDGRDTYYIDFCSTLGENPNPADIMNGWRSECNVPLPNPGPNVPQNLPLPNLDRNDPCKTPSVCAVIENPGQGDPQSNSYCPNQCMKDPIGIIKSGKTSQLFFCQHPGGTNGALQFLVERACSKSMNYNQDETKPCPAGKDCNLFYVINYGADTYMLGFCVPPGYDIDNVAAMNGCDQPPNNTPLPKIDQNDPCQFKVCGVGTGYFDDSACPGQCGAKLGGSLYPSTRNEQDIDILFCKYDGFENDDPDNLAMSLIKRSCAVTSQSGSNQHPCDSGDYCGSQLVGLKYGGTKEPINLKFCTKAGSLIDQVNKCNIRSQTNSNSPVVPTIVAPRPAISPNVYGPNRRQQSAQPNYYRPQNMQPNYSNQPQGSQPNYNNQPQYAPSNLTPQSNSRPLQTVSNRQRTAYNPQPNPNVPQRGNYPFNPQPNPYVPQRSNYPVNPQQTSNNPCIQICALEPLQFVKPRNPNACLCSNLKSQPMTISRMSKTAFFCADDQDALNDQLLKRACYVQSSRAKRKRCPADQSCSASVRFNHNSRSYHTLFCAPFGESAIDVFNALNNCGQVSPAGPSLLSSGGAANQYPSYTGNSNPLNQHSNPPRFGNGRQGVATGSTDFGLPQGQSRPVGQPNGFTSFLANRPPRRRYDK